MSAEISVSQAHRHASNAEDYTKEGLLSLIILIQAADEHFKSAEAFQQCVERTGDERTKKILKMFSNEHEKLGKDLQKKISKLQEEGGDPTQPHPPQITPSRNRSENFRSKSPYESARRPPYYPGPPHSGYSSPQIDESYMVLGNQSESHETFDQFWKSLEGMLDKLSQPVAFATAPLAQQNSASPSGKENKSVGSMSTLRNPPKQRHNHDKPIADSFYEIEEVSAGDDDDSFFMVSPSKGSNSLTQENDALKARVLELETRLQRSERMRIEQEEQLRERVEVARREAHRVKASGILPPRPPPPLDLGPLNVALSSLPQNKEVQLNRRIKDLEDELKLSKLENEKQKAIIVKFKERWEKLKESAKKKRQAKLNFSNETNLAEQRIDEEPEAETEAIVDL
ncbi:hypothetical protein Clacol_006443 [Clathrus columnatus]|uniref:Uncharacterized protein n=1 Tax=Clathrus columnatus TaxID=1419009 RepID=A0AAV5AEP1_9AGAM|nr:hypothetical protein Clacol_006443 [Clathrus columnatus]